MLLSYIIRNRHVTTYLHFVAKSIYGSFKTTSKSLHYYVSWVMECLNDDKKHPFQILRQLIVDCPRLRPSVRKTKSLTDSCRKKGFRHMQSLTHVHFKKCVFTKLWSVLFCEMCWQLELMNKYWTGIGVREHIWFICQLGLANLQLLFQLCICNAIIFWHILFGDTTMYFSQLNILGYFSS